MTPSEPVLVASLSDLAEGTWVVRTESGTAYVLDMEHRTCTRILGDMSTRPDGRAALRRDGEELHLVGVVRCAVGERAVFLVQVRADALTHRTTTTVLSIERA